MIELIQTNRKKQNRDLPLFLFSLSFSLLFLLVPLCLIFFLALLSLHAGSLSDNFRGTFEQKTSYRADLFTFTCILVFHVIRAKAFPKVFTCRKLADLTAKNRDGDASGNNIDGPYPTATAPPTRSPWRFSGWSLEAATSVAPSLRTARTPPLWCFCPSTSRFCAILLSGFGTTPVAKKHTLF